MSDSEVSLNELFPSVGGCTGREAADLTTATVDSADLIDLDNSIPDTPIEAECTNPENNTEYVHVNVKNKLEIELEIMKVAMEVTTATNVNLEAEVAALRNALAVVRSPPSNKGEKPEIPKSKKRNRDIAAPRLNAELSDSFSDITVLSAAETDEANTKAKPKLRKNTAVKKGVRLNNTTAQALSKKLQLEFNKKAVARTYVVHPSDIHNDQDNTNGSNADGPPVILGVISIPPPAAPVPSTLAPAIDEPVSKPTKAEVTEVALDADEPQFTQVVRRNRIRKQTNEQAAVSAMGRVQAAASQPATATISSQATKLSEGYVPPITVCDGVDEVPPKRHR